LFLHKSKKNDFGNVQKTEDTKKMFVRQIVWTIKVDLLLLLAESEKNNGSCGDNPQKNNQKKKDLKNWILFFI